MKQTTTLRTKALEYLKQHRTPDAATGPFAEFLVEEPPMLRALARAYLQSLAPEPISRQQTGRHRRPLGKIPSEQQKLANLMAERSYTHQIFLRKLRGGKLLGEVHVHELRAYAKQAAEAAMQFVNRGHDDAVDFFACTALKNYCVAANPNDLVREVIKPAVVVEIYEKAQTAANKALAEGSERMLQDLIEAAEDGFDTPSPKPTRGRPPRAPEAPARRTAAEK